MIVLQKIKTQVSDPFEMAFKYFSIMSIVNDLDLVKRDVQLIAYAVTENKDVSEIKSEFVEKFGSSMPTVGNIISKLYKRNILQKDKRIVKVHPALVLDFNANIALAITLKNNGNQG